MIWQRGRRLPWFLAVALLVQAGGAVYFIGDALDDLMTGGTGVEILFEVPVALALVIGVGFGIATLRRAQERLAVQERALASASGALAEVVMAQFRDWGLTAAERDVGLLALKGLDVAEIAGLRGAAAGTVRAQLTRIYAKAGVTGRAQFASIFVEELLAGPLPEPPARLASNGSSR